MNDLFVDSARDEMLKVLRLVADEPAEVFCIVVDDAARDLAVVLGEDAHRAAGLEVAVDSLDAGGQQARTAFERLDAARIDDEIALQPLSTVPKSSGKTSSFVPVALMLPPSITTILSAILRIRS